MMDKDTAAEILRSTIISYEPQIMGTKPISIRRCEEIADFIEQQAKKIEELEQERNELRQSLKTPISHDMIIEARRERDEWEEKYNQSCIKRTENIDEFFELKGEIAILQSKLDEWKENHECNLDFKNQLVSENRNQRAVIQQQEKYAESWHLSIEAKNEWAELMCNNNGKFKMRDDECCEYEDKDCGCQWYKICRKETELIMEI